MNRIDFSPYRRSMVGFDRLFDMLENQNRGGSNDNYPPFNIEKRGNDAYRKATPFFLGLVLGNVATIVLWLILDGMLGRTNHQFMPH